MDVMYEMEHSAGTKILVPYEYKRKQMLRKMTEGLPKKVLAAIAGFRTILGNQVYACLQCKIHRENVHKQKETG